MTDTAASSLRDLVFTTEARPVIDELAALDALLPDISDEVERHAALLERLPPLLDLRGRALVHAREYQRFLTLAEADPAALEYMVDIGNAIALLSHAGEIAMLLVPPCSPEDHFAKAMLAKERGEQYRNGDGVHDPKLMERALRRPFADSHPRLVIGSRIPPGMEEASRRFSGAVLPQPMAGDGTAPGIYHLEHGLALETWFDDPPDLALLLDEARTLLAAIEVWSQAEPPSLFMYGGRRGALILAYARLCRIGLWPARSSADLVAKMEVERLISERPADPDPIRAAVEIALGVGRRIARQGGRFVTVLGGVEL
ncbi:MULTISPECIES: hypothetical protein [Bosea]|jgi:hypothetical protein|uniref:hypothetical protein n=1 Tax=Bosea TaxID=85413 RepID=UPI00214F88A1|nr:MULTISPECIES: hypothetical protein [Bosea]MCR4524518.1 hypothetical protein [Bosea sp. 47.2.35]MDR6831322.1 hypothetical protein [Bosea robiniae]MDR6898034.1 hypothetical protein [Bosea sp. BE109]MDR7141459.1 hypothetical protein [Bosea sp. BE168]MDR7178093.1 hypothetical protein [Bosea sp. BE271]